MTTMVSMVSAITIVLLIYLFVYFYKRTYLLEYFQVTPITRGSDVYVRDCAASGGVYANDTCNIPQDIDKAHCEKSGGTYENGRCSIPSVQCGLMGGTYVNGNCISSDPTVQARISCESGGGTYSSSTGVCKENSAKGNQVQPEFDTTENDNSERTMYPGADIQMTTFSPPYEQQPIQNMDDYELNQIYTNEADKVLSKELRDKLMSQYPMNWTTYPQSSAQFQAGYRESFQNATQDVPDDAKPYQNISGSTMAPPDMGAVEREERKILQTYTPTFPPTGQTYDTRDANALIKKIYDAKGLIPEVRHRADTNVYEIVGTRRKNEKITYEDEEAPVTKRANPGAGEGTVPVVSTESRDPFYAPENNKGSGNPWQYTAWTPGLERVFAPTEAKQNWY